MKRKVLSFLLVIVLLTGILPAEAIAADSVWDWKGYTPISTYSDLLAIKSNLAGKYYLTNDITVTGTMSPMGSMSQPFTGILDGNGYSIKNLTINNSSTANGRGVGLFQANQGIIRNLTLDGATLTCTSYRYSLTDVRSTYIGFLAGKNEGEIVNCTVLPNCTLDATIYSHAYIGAFAGYSTGLIQHCTNNAAINIHSEYNDYTVSQSDGSTQLFNNYMYVGGIAGFANTVKNCTNNGAIVSVGIGENNEDGAYGCFGGIAGAGYRGTIDQCRNTASLYITGTDYAIATNMYVGGIVGSYSGYSAEELAPISRCESTGYIRVKGGMNYVGGIAGTVDHVHLLYCHHAASIRVDTKYYYDFGYGYVYFGGIVGHLNWSNMTACYKSSGSMLAYADTAYPRAILGGFLVGMADGYEEGYESDGACNITMCYNYATSYGYNTKQVSSWCIGGLVGSADGEVNVTTSYYPYYGNNTYFRGVYFNNSTGTVSPTSATLINFANRSTYTGFDFINDWKMDTGEYGGALLRKTPDHTHSLSYRAAYDYTCTSSGRIEHWYCANCDTYYRDSAATKVISADEIYPPAAHDYGEWYVYKPATCTAAGEKRSDCSGCDRYYSETIPMIGHSYEAVVTPPTCTEGGYTTYTCSCGDSYVADQVAAGHVYEAVVTPPTCTENGYTTYTCHCGDTYTADEVAANGHDYEAVVTPPTCTENGYTTYTCHCGDTYTDDVVTAGGHTYEAVVTPPTCTEDGYTTYTCHCGDTYTDDEITASGHSYEAVVTPPTCTENGYTTYTCHCGDTYTDDEITASGHSYEAVVTPPTCTEDGYTTYTCHCGDTYTGDVIAAGGHSYEAVVTPPTCTEDGYTTYTCHCGDSYIDDVVTAGGHSYEAVVTPPTCTEDGYTTYTCHCGDTYTDNVVTASGHSYKAKVTKPTCTKGGYTTHTCEHCGDSYTDSKTEATGHSYGAWKTTQKASCTAAGKQTRTCKNCTHSETKAIAATGHSYTEKVTAPTCTKDGYTTHTCHCGASYKSNATKATGHSFTKYVSNGDATLAADGTKTAKCDHGCGATKTVADPGSRLYPTNITSDVYHVAGGYISGISAGTTVSKLLDGINEDGVRIVNGTKTVAANEKVGTGMVAQLVVKGKVVDEVTIVVTGDTNGDGNITVTDMLAIKSHILKKTTLAGAAALAADVSGDGGISVTDFIQAKSHILGKSAVKAQKAVIKAK